MCHMDCLACDLDYRRGVRRSARRVGPLDPQFGRDSVEEALVGDAFARFETVAELAVGGDRGAVTEGPDVGGVPRFGGHGKATGQHDPGADAMDVDGASAGLAHDDL